MSLLYLEYVFHFISIYCHITEGTIQMYEQESFKASDQQLPIEDLTLYSVSCFIPSNCISWHTHISEQLWTQVIHVGLS